MFNNYYDYFVNSDEAIITFQRSASKMGGTKKYFRVSDEIINFLKSHRNYRIVPLSGDCIKFRFGFASEGVSYVGSWAEVVKDIVSLYIEEIEAGNIKLPYEPAKVEVFMDMQIKANRGGWVD